MKGILRWQWLYLFWSHIHFLVVFCVIFLWVTFDFLRNEMFSEERKQNDDGKNHPYYRGTGFNQTLCSPSVGLRAPNRSKLIFAICRQNHIVNFERRS